MKVFHEDPILVLFVVAGLGYLVGCIRIHGFALGLSAVLFTGLGLSALDAKLQLPEFVYTFGLALFVYTIGLASGPTFFRAMRRSGLRTNLAVGGVLVGGTGLVVLAHVVLGIGGAQSAGVLSGSLTNTPALAGALDWLKQHAALPSQLSDPVVAYSLTYPMGVIGVLLAIFVLQRRWRIDYAADALSAATAGSGLPITSRTALVARPELPPLDQLRADHGWPVTFGRVQHDGRQAVARGDLLLRPGDLVTVVGSTDDVTLVVDYLGAPSGTSASQTRRDLDVRRIFVSNRKIVGQRIGTLDLENRFEALVTRLRRGDTDTLATEDTVLELGDRVRVLAPPQRMGEVSRLFGDSYRDVAEMDIISFGFGIALGLLLGHVPIPTPGGGDFRLGPAGGTLLVGLVLGAIQRTGPLVWQPPYSTNLTLRQLGTVLFLAGIGTRSGPALATTLRHGNALPLVAAGVVVTVAAALATLLIGRHLLHLPMGVLVGVVAGMQTQPAVLAFATEQAGNDLPNVGYSTVYPLALVMKILLAQVLLVALGP